MNRLLVALLAAVDALIAAAVGVAAVLAPLTVLWVVGLSGADWGALWPAAVRVWQLGQLVPLQITLPPEYLNTTGIPADAASFWLSLAPLAVAGFTAAFAARSGARAAGAGAWAVGVGAGTVVTALVALVLWRTSANPVAAVFGWQALLLPTAVFALPSLAGALVGAWRHGDDGLVDRVRARVQRDGIWRGVPEAGARGVGIALAGFVAVGALLVAVATVARGGEVIALFEAAHADAVGATVIALAQLAYLPTLVVWGGAFAAGPGFSLGTGTAVSPAGTNLGVLPGIPALGIVPESISPWMLLTTLLLVAVGFAAGAAAQARLRAAAAEHPAAEGVAPRLAALAVVAVGGGAGAALLAALASGSAGPGRLADVGPAPGPVGLAVALELAVGAAIALFTAARSDADVAGVLGDRAGTTLPSTSAATRAPVTRASVDRASADRAFGEGASASPVAPAAAGRSAPIDAAAPAPRAAAAPDDTDTEAFEAADLDPLAGLGEPDGDGR